MSSSSSPPPLCSGSGYRQIRSQLGACLLGSLPSCIFGCVWAAQRPQVSPTTFSWLIATSFALFAAAIYVVYILDRQVKKNNVSCKIMAVFVFLLTMGTAIAEQLAAPKTALAGALFYPIPFAYSIVNLQLFRGSPEKWNSNALSYYGVCLFLLAPMLRALNDYVVVREADIADIWTCFIRLDGSIFLTCLVWRLLIQAIAGQNQDR